MKPVLNYSTDKILLRKPIKNLPLDNNPTADDYNKSVGRKGTNGGKKRRWVGLFIDQYY